MKKSQLRRLIKEEIQKLNELEFDDVGAYKEYSSNHDIRKTTMVTVGGKQMQASEADKISNEKSSGDNNGSNKNLEKLEKSINLQDNRAVSNEDKEKVKKIISVLDNSVKKYMNDYNNWAETEFQDKIAKANGINDDKDMFIKKLQAHAQKNNQNLSKSIAQFASNTSDPRGTVDVLNNMLQKRQEVLKNSRESIKKKQEMYHKLAKPIPKLKDIITNIDDNGNVSVDTGKISKEGAIEIADKTRKQIKALEDSGKGKGKKYITLIKIRQKLDRNLENNMFDSSEELYKENPNEPDFY